VQQHDDAMKKH